MKQQRVDLAGLTGTGRTKAEAKVSLDRQITEALDGDYSPRLIEWKGRQCIIWRTPGGIVSVYRRVCDAARESLWISNGTCHHGLGSTLDSAEKAAALNLAMGEADIDSNVMPEIICAWPSVMAQFRSWLGFQRAFAAYKRDSPTEPSNAIHAWACANATLYTPKESEVK